MKTPSTTPFIHSAAICESSKIGPGTRIWAFSHVLPGATVGADCNICDFVFIENDVQIGDRVTVKCGVQLWDGISVEDDVFIGPNVTFTNDKLPKSRKPPEFFARTIIKQGASIGANATIGPGLILAENCMIGAGAVVTRNVPPNAIVVGNPARIGGYRDHNGKSRSSPPGAHLEPEPEGNTTRFPLSGGAWTSKLPQFEDLRGCLTVAEAEREIPFYPRRFFFIHAVPSVETQGEHAHKICEQFLVCVSGTLNIMLDDAHSISETNLKTGDCLYIPAGIWATQYRFSVDAILAVLASHSYDPGDYIRSYQEWIQWKLSIPSAIDSGLVDGKPRNGQGQQL